MALRQSSRRLLQYLLDTKSQHHNVKTLTKGLGISPTSSHIRDAMHELINHPTSGVQKIAERPLTLHLPEENKPQAKQLLTQSLLPNPTQKTRHPLAVRLFKTQSQIKGPLHRDILHATKSQARTQDQIITTILKELKIKEPNQLTQEHVQKEINNLLNQGLLKELKTEKGTKYKITPHGKQKIGI